MAFPISPQRNDLNGVTFASILPVIESSLARAGAASRDSQNAARLDDCKTKSVCQHSSRSISAERDEAHIIVGGLSREERLHVENDLLADGLGSAIGI